MITEHLRIKCQELRPVGPQIPFEKLATLPETYFSIFNKPPFSENPYYLVAAAVKTNHLRSHEGIRELVDYSQAKSKNFEQWTAVRKIGSPEYSLTGFEGYFIDKLQNDPVKIAKHIASMGLIIEQEEPKLVRELLNKGINGLSYTLLDDVDAILGKTIRDCRLDMTSTAKDYQRNTTRIVESMPEWATKIYYLKDGQETLHQFFIIPRLPIHPALRNPHILTGLNPQELHGRQIMKLLAQGGHPLVRGGMKSTDPHW